MYFKTDLITPFVVLHGSGRSQLDLLAHIAYFDSLICEFSVEIMWADGLQQKKSNQLTTS